MTKNNAGTSQSLLVKRARRGEPEAFEALVDTHSARLLSLARRVVGDREDAEDVVQNSLWKAHRRLADCREDTSFANWLARITVNEGIGLLRRRKREPSSQPELQPDRLQSDVFLGSATPQSPEDICRLNEMRHLVEQSLDRLEPAYRTVLTMRAFEERSCREIADALGLTLGTVKTRVHRARQMLRTTLRRHLIGTSERRPPQRARKADHDFHEHLIPLVSGYALRQRE